MRSWKRIAAAVLSVFVVGCGNQSNPRQRPDPAALPAAKADLDFAGAVTGHVSEVRIAQCGSKKAGTLADFYASMYFQFAGTWYSLEMVTLNPFPPSGKEAYSGPGTYSASALLRDVVVLSSATLHGAHAWGANPDYVTTLQVNSEPTSVQLGSARGTLMHWTSAKEMVLWPMRSDQTGPAPYPRPAAAAMVTVVGSWSCAATSQPSS